MMTSILRSIKPAWKRVRINPCRDTANNALELPTTIGIRQDNMWLTFNEGAVPDTEEAYDGAIFIDKMWPG